MCVTGPTGTPFATGTPIISHHAGQAEAWLEVGEVAEARAELDRLLKTSFGVYHSDDNQMERWADWAAKALACGAVGPEAILPLLRASPVMYTNRRGHDPDRWRRRSMR